MIFVGIDPGQSGAIAILRAYMSMDLIVYDMPLVKIKKIVDANKLARMIMIKPSNYLTAIIEDVHAMPGQGVSSMFNFGRNLGVVEGVLGTLDVKTIYTKPSVWKTVMGLSRDKNLSREMAMEKFPRYKNLFSRKKDDGRAEAALLALFGAKHFNTSAN